MPLVRGSEVHLGPWKDSAAENGPGGGPLTRVLPEGLKGGPSEHKVLWRGQAGVTGLPSCFQPLLPAGRPRRLLQTSPAGPDALGGAISLPSQFRCND